MTEVHSAPRAASNAGVLDTLSAALGDMVVATKEEHGEVIITVVREPIEQALRLLRDSHDYQQLMEIAGVDFPSRSERFEVVYMLLSLTRNHRIMIKVNAAEATPVPTVTTLWPVAGWLEREIFDMFGVIFSGNPDLRRILTDYGFEGHPFRKDFPLTGHIEMRYSEEDQRVVYEPVELPQDLRSFDFMSPWEGADYVLPGDEKAGATTRATTPETRGESPAKEKKTTDGPGDAGGGQPANAAAMPGPGASVTTGGTVSGQGQGEPVPQPGPIAAPGAPDPTESRPDRAPRNPEAGIEGGQGAAPEGG